MEIKGEPDPDAGDCYLNFTLKSVTAVHSAKFRSEEYTLSSRRQRLLIKLTDLVGAQFPRPALSLKKIVGLIPHADTELLNVGVSVDTQNQLVDFRVEIGESTIVTRGQTSSTDLSTTGCKEPIGLLLVKRIT